MRVIKPLVGGLPFMASGLGLAWWVTNCVGPVYGRLQNYTPHLHSPIVLTHPSICILRLEICLDVREAEATSRALQGMI